MASRCRPATRVFTMAAMLAMSAMPLLAQIPTNLRVDGTPENRHVAGSTPTFCWDFSGSQTNWQIQVDDDGGFSASAAAAGSAPSVWFWDSGTQPKGSAGSSRCAVMRQVTRRGTVSLPLDARAGDIHWRVRVHAAGSWGPWVASTLRVNQPPMMPAALSVSLEPKEGRLAALPSVAVTTGRIWHVSPSGDDEAEGSESAPFRTLTRAARALQPGDTLLVHGGTYEENVVISALSGHASGQPGREIVVRARPGEAPVLRAPSAGTRIALQIGQDSRLSDWVFDGLTVGGAATQAGIVIGGARRIRILGCRWEGTLEPAASGIRAEAGSETVEISGCQFDQSLAAQIEITAAQGVMVRGNEFSAFDRGPAILARRGAAGVSIEGNRFRDAVPSPAAVELAGTAPGTRIARNLFYRLQGSGSAAVRTYRGAGLVVENNVFHAVEGTALQLNEHAPYGVIRNNIFASCGTGLGFPGAASSVLGAVVDFNLFSANGTDVAWGGASQTLLDHAPAGNCLGVASGSCDPLFLRPEAGDFRPGAGSPAIDAGDPFASVPEGGGARVDIGRHEHGLPEGQAVEEHQVAFSVSDATPRLAWTMDDLDLRAGGTDTQARFQVQVDTRPTFDGAGGSPLLDSGIVTSSQEQFVVPADRALPPGDYYVRVRQWDTHASTPGAWSSPAPRFRVTEPGSIRLAGAWPAPGALVADGGTPIEATLASDNGMLDPSSIRLLVNGLPVEAAVSGGSRGASLSWVSPQPFAAGTRVTVRVTAGGNGPESTPLDTTYWFLVTGPAPAAPTGLRVGR